jgi:hypothetical protein
MDEGLHYYKPQAYKIKHTSQNKIKCQLLIWFFSPFYFFESLYFKMLPSNCECELCRFANKMIMFQETL